MSSSRSRGKKPQEEDDQDDSDDDHGATNPLSSPGAVSVELSLGLGFPSTPLSSPSSDPMSLRQSAQVAAAAALLASNSQSPLPAMNVSSTSLLSPSSAPLPLRRSARVAAALASNSQSPLLPAMDMNSGYESLPEDVPIARLIGEKKLRQVKSSRVAVGKSSSGGSGSKRKRGRPRRAVRIEEITVGESVVRRENVNDIINVEDVENEEKKVANGDDSESDDNANKIASDEEHANASSTRRCIKLMGELIIVDDKNDKPAGSELGASIREKPSYKGKWKEKPVSHEILDSEPDTDSDTDYSKKRLRVHVKRVVEEVEPFLSAEEQVQMEPQYEEMHDEEILDRSPSPRREQQKNRAKKLAPTYARSGNEKGEQTVKDDLPLPDGLGRYFAAMKTIKGYNSNGGKIPWKPSNESNRGLLGLKVPPITELVLNGLAEIIGEDVEALASLPDSIRSRLSFVLCRTRKMDMTHLTKLMEGNLKELRLSDCSWATEKNFEDAFKDLDKSNLELLQLDRCGRCLPDYVLYATLARGPNSLPSLTQLSLKGHYSLSDEGLADIVSSAPLLNSLNLSQCSLLTSEGIVNLIDKQALLLKGLYIDDCQNVNAMSILPSLKKVKSLVVLSMAGIPSVSNEFVHELMPVCGSTIKELNFADCDKLTSCAIKLIGENCPKLSALDIRNLTELKDSALAHLANSCSTMEKLQLRQSSFSDEVIAAFVKASGENLIELSLNKVAKVGNLTARAIADACHFRLKKLDLSFCRNLDDSALGTIVDNCSSLMILKIFGCSQVTDVFFEGYFNRSVRILGPKGHSQDYIETPHY